MQIGLHLQYIWHCNCNLYMLQINTVMYLMCKMFNIEWLIGSLERPIKNLQENGSILSVLSSRNILHIMSVNIGLQIDITAGILFNNVSTDIFNIPNKLLDAIGMIWMQQEIRTNCLTLSSIKLVQIHKNCFWPHSKTLHFCSLERGEIIEVYCAMYTEDINSAPHLSAIRATCPAHHIFLDLITWIIFSEE